jgi:hypothetical protein
VLYIPVRISLMMYSVVKCKSRQLQSFPNNDDDDDDDDNNNNNNNNTNSDIITKYHTTEILHTETDCKCRF